MNSSHTLSGTDPTADAQAILGGLAYVEQCIAQTLPYAVVTSNENTSRSVMVRRFIRNSTDKFIWAHLKHPARSQHEFLERVLEGFGFEPFESSIEDLRSILRVFLTHQRAENRGIVVLLENAHGSSAHALKEMQRLSKIQIARRSALTFVLTGPPELNRVLDSPAMLDISELTTRRYSLDRLTRETADEYLHRALSAPDFSEDVELPGESPPVHVISTRLTQGNGVPHGLDDDAVQIIEDAVKDLATHLPNSSQESHDPMLSGAKDVGNGTGKLILSLNGDEISQFLLEKEHVVVGRNEHNDVTIPSRYVSRHHALLVNRPAGAYLVDLKSTNGTSVNSLPVEYYALQHNDVISIGNHRLKYINASSTNRMAMPDASAKSFHETMIMRSSVGLSGGGPQVSAEDPATSPFSDLGHHRTARSN